MSREPIIVDGVDVSGCVCRAEEKCILKDDECCFFPNCDYKNWQRKEQECEFWKKELDKTHLLMLKRQDELVKEILKNDQLKADNEILEKDRATVDAIIETLKAQFRQLKEENAKLKELVKTKIEDLCDSCGASSMMSMPCKVYEQALQEIEEIAKNYFNNDWTGLAIILEQILEKCEVLKDE